MRSGQARVDGEKEKCRGVDEGEKTLKGPALNRQATPPPAARRPPPPTPAPAASPSPGGAHPPPASARGGGGEFVCLCVRARARARRTGSCETGSWLQRGIMEVAGTMRALCARGVVFHPPRPPRSGRMAL